MAEDRWTARAALDDVVVDYEELPAVADPYEALEPGAPLVEPEWGDNVILRRSFQSGDADAALAAAGRRAAGSLACGRLAGSPIEPRGCVASYDPGSGRLDRLGRHAAAACPSDVPRRDAGDAGGLGPCLPAPCRGRVRPQAAALPGAGDAGGGQPAAGTTREVDRGARRESHRRRPQPGHRCRVRGRLRGGRADLGAPGARRRRRRRTDVPARLDDVVRDRVLPPDGLRHPEPQGRSHVGRRRTRARGLRIEASARTSPRSRWTASSNGWRGRPACRARPCGGATSSRPMPSRTSGRAGRSSIRGLPGRPRPAPRGHRRAGLPRRAGGSAGGGPPARAGPRPGADARGRGHPRLADELGL